MQTPWGISQTVDEVAVGITHVTTAGHGGFKLSDERHAKVQAKYPQFKTFAGGAWYEEDCDVAIVVATFPEHFSAESVELANKMIAPRPEVFWWVTDSPTLTHPTLLADSAAQPHIESAMPTPTKPKDDFYKLLGGVKVNRPMPSGPAPKYAPSRIVDQWNERKMVISQPKNDDDKPFCFRYEKNRLVIEVMGTQVYFSKTSRGGGKFVDSREPNKRFTRDEIRAEIYRMLEDSSETDRAMLALEFGV